MLLTGFLAVSTVALAKHLASYFHPFQLMFLYAAFGIIVLTPLMLMSKQLPWPIFAAHTHRRWWQWQLFRAVLEFSAFSLSFYALTRLALPTQTAISFSSPIFASLFAIGFLKEASHPRLWIALALGMLGVWMISDPFSGPTALPILPVLAVTLASAMFGLCGTLIRHSVRHVPPAMVAFAMLGLTTVVSLPFAWMVWKPLMPEVFWWCVLLGCGTAAVQYCVSKALSLASVTRLVPLSYVNLLWATLFGYVFFNETITAQTIIGSAIIMSAVLVAARKRKRSN